MHKEHINRILMGVMLIRLLFLGTYPLADTTEARYGEMGRLMVETGNWITPQFEKGIPFWGKPPLSFWLTAVSFKMFGIHEFSARLPSFFLGIAVIAMVFNLGQYRAGQKIALTACVIMASSIIFWISSGAVMTDHCLLAGTTLSMVAFWRCMSADTKTGRIWGWSFFVGLAIGLMAKGPIAAVLIFFPVLSWTLVQKKLRLLLRLPWMTGIGLTLAGTTHRPTMEMHTDSASYAGDFHCSEVDKCTWMVPCWQTSFIAGFDPVLRMRQRRKA